MSELSFFMCELTFIAKTTVVQLTHITAPDFFFRGHVRGFEDMSEESLSLKGVVNSHFGLKLHFAHIAAFNGAQGRQGRTFVKRVTRWFRKWFFHNLAHALIL